ncbi:FkbM family methyltransferase [Hydrogenophaga electricum]|uniref:FkbM family methyltransferase n=1 Tax=Hydrogenophaga electricum TaxID=1230953 RepID=UPI0024E0CF70|nr:FkbM family methyltransferase [Hydrogenophaga electricum]
MKPFRSILWWKKLLTILLKRDLRKTLLLHNVAAATEHHFVLKSKDFSSIIDVGANRGQFALAAAHFCKSAEIFSFEPLSKPTLVFKSVFRDISRVKLFQVAIGKSNSEEQMHVSEKDDSSSLLPIGEIQTEIFPGTGQAGLETVRVAKLSSILNFNEIRSPVLLKVDVQGFELAVIEGLLDCIAYFDSIYIECSFVELYRGQGLAHQVIDILHANSFKIVGVYNETFDRNGRSIQADLLFSRISAKEQITSQSKIIPN